MNKKSLYYYLGVLLLGLAVLSYRIMRYLGITAYWLFVIFLVAGIIFIAISDRKIWVKIATIILASISYFIFFTVIFYIFSVLYFLFKITGTGELN